jgi:glycerophosphoryl diester phosphodiesterase
VDISIFNKYYLKASLEDIENIFKPFNYTGFSSKYFNPNQPFLGYSDLFFENTFHDFAYSDEYDATYDCLSMAEMKGTEDKKLFKMDIRVEYEEILKNLDFSTFLPILKKYVELFEKAYFDKIIYILLESKTNFKANYFFKNQLELIVKNYNNLNDLVEIIYLNKLEKVLIEAYLSSYSTLYNRFKKEYYHAYSNLFDNFYLNDYTEIEEHFKVNDDYKYKIKGKTGLSLSDGKSITRKKANKLCKYLKEKSFINKNTRTETIGNIFTNNNNFVKTPVTWEGSIPELKYFINCLHIRKVIKESSYQKKWMDASNCFKKENLEITNTTFSKNTDNCSEQSKIKIDSIITKFMQLFRESSAL